MTPTETSTAHDVPLAGLTTLRVGGPASRLVTAGSEAELIDVVRAADAAGEPLLVLGGGSNLVIADEGFQGTVVRVATTGVHAEFDGRSAVTVRVAAGEDWDAVVRRAIAEGWAGLESMSGVPGLAGATPIQNVGAYGHEVAETIAAVRVWDRPAGEVRTISGADCGFAYRSSRFKAEPGRYVVLEVVFRLPLGAASAPVGYAELARALEIATGERAPMPQVRETVLALRRGKGMVLDPADHDTWSAGSFFTNPILDSVTELPDGAPRWPQPDGRVKTSAAWLIERAGVDRGFTVGSAAVSGKHTLALTNRGGATAKEILALAAEVRDRVHRTFGITLVNEPVLVNCTM